jgi:GT2 family glycosyltransferase
MRQLYTLLGCPAQGSLAGRCCGAALNFLPAADSTGDQSVDWMNLCCTLVRREALPQPPLLDFFQGYSLMEDTALTFHLGRCWRLSVPSTARVFHDVGPASYKDRPFARERMETLNRWFVMRHIMGQDHFIWDLRQLAWQCLSLTLLLRTSSGWRRFPAAFAGKVAGLTSVILHRHHWRGYIPVPAP